jgi:hypothetical protein
MTKKDFDICYTISKLESLIESIDKRNCSIIFKENNPEIYGDKMKFKSYLVNSPKYDERIFHEIYQRIIPLIKNELEIALKNCDEDLKNS